jgi:ATP-dependent DNA helicase DinG
MNNRYVVIDVETTGNQPVIGDKIIQIGAVTVEDGMIIDRFSSYVNPNREIPTFVTQLTGITAADVNSAPTFDEVAPKLLQMLDGAYFVAHNVPFDLSFIQEELTNAGYEPFTGPAIDTVELARFLLPTASGYKLNQLADLFQIEHTSPHQADSDAQVTAELLLLLLEKMSALPLITLQRLQPLMKKLKSDIAIIVDEFVQSKITTYAIAEEADYEVFNHIAFKRFGKHDQQINTDELSDFQTFKHVIMNKDGTLQNSFSQYELREGQQMMMDSVHQAFTNYEHALIEAGTGTGKTLGYLLPAVHYAIEQESPVVISTNTVQLQQQILERDIPLLRKVVPFPFRVALLKGRQHYLCLRKFEQQLLQSEEDHLDAALTKAMILVWLLETNTGDVEELNLPSGGSQFWYKVNSEGSTCLNRHCPWFTKCFYHRARRLAKEADIIITNHALLFSNTANDHQLLPSFDHVVIDEAHHLEEVVSDHFGIKLDYFSIHTQLQRLGYSDGHEMVSKLTPIYNDLHVKSFAERFTTYDSCLKDVNQAIDDLFTLIHQYVKREFLTPKTEVGRLSYRYDIRKEKGKTWQAIVETADLSVSKINDLTKLLRKVEQQLQEGEEQLQLPAKGLLVDFQALINNIEKVAEVLYLLLLEKDENRVCWMEIDARGARNATYLFAKPIDISMILADQFFAKKRSAILTSATLTVSNKSFSYMINRLGLEDFCPITEVIPSPFSFEQQTKLCFPTDIPNIKEVRPEQYVPIIAKSISKIAEATNGRMLVLFTSYDMLKNTYSLLKEEILNEDFMLIAQGVSSGSRAKLTKNFKQFNKAILLGTSSFWEGVDIPGEDLSCIVIVRLPFAPPDNPVIAARSEKIKEQGGNPFSSLSLPQAIIRFKQGFGRLIRTSQDRGVVFVFDRRISTTRYGKSFIQALPPVPVHEGSLTELIDVVEQWL